MSDIPDNGGFALGILNNNSQNFGPTAAANQGLTAAQTGMVGAQTQGQQIENASNALNLQALRIGLSQLYKMPGWRADQTNQSDQSGTSSGGTSTQSPGAAPAQSGGASSGSAASSPAQSGGASSGDQVDDDIGDSVSSPDTRLRNAFTVNPLGTPDEQQNILQAAKISAIPQKILPMHRSPPSKET